MSINISVRIRKINWGVQIMEIIFQTHFSVLTSCKYKSKEFFEKHRYIHFDTLVDLGKYEVICVFKTTPSKFDYQNYTVFDSSDEFSSYISKCKESEYYNTDVSCSYGDKLITLSTCEYSQENGRLVVVAKKVK